MDTKIKRDSPDSDACGEALVLTGVVAENIHKLRKYYRITQKELAAALGVTDAYISQIEHGNISPRVQTIDSIARILAIDYELLLQPGGYRVITKNREKMPITDIAPR